MIDTSSEEWRVECEARLLLETWETDQIKEYLKKLKPARQKTLQDELRKQWQANRKGKA